MVKKDKVVKTAKIDKSVKKKEKSTSDKTAPQDENDYESKVFVIKTTQTAAFKQVVERLSNVLSDCSLIIIKPDDNVDAVDSTYESESDNDDEESSTKKTIKKQKKKNLGGIRALRLSEDKSILIKLNLDADKFELFYCSEPKTLVGIDIHNFYNLLKMINDDDPLVIYMNKNDRSSLYIQSTNEDPNTIEQKNIKIFLMDITNQEMKIPQAHFDVWITMKTDKFHDVCKHLNNNAVYVDIRAVRDEITFIGQNEWGKTTHTYKDANKSINKNKQNDLFFQGVYEIKNLLSFSKCAKLCQTVELYLKNDFPLVLVINVASLGKLYVFL
ncbi:hypothetical protein EON71_01370, partial [bacterium]